MNFNYLKTICRICILCIPVLTGCGEKSSEDKASSDKNSMQIQLDEEAVQQTRARKNLRQSLSIARRQLPQNIAPGMKLEDIDIDDNYIIYKITLKSSPDNLIINEDSKKEILNLAGDQAPRIVLANLGLKYIYSHADDSREITISAEELRQYVDSISRTGE